MFSLQNRQVINLSRAREETPIVSVFLKDNPQTIYSLAIPQSKSWIEFGNKVKDKFDIDSSLSLKFFESNDDNVEFAEYNTTEHDMSKIKHKTKLAIVIQNHKDNADDDDEKKNSMKSSVENNEDSFDTNDSIDTNHENDIEEDNIDNTQVDKITTNDEDENTVNLGLNVDLFGRNIDNINNSNQLNLQFDMKEIYLLLQTYPLKCFHENNKFTIMKDEKNGIILRTRRLIWPTSFQSYPINQTFEYNLNTIKEHWYWAIILCHGGRFAAAIYNGNKNVLHKTISRYVVRKKQGKRQANFLAMGGHSKSAGSYKRAWNEKKLLQEIQYILSSWQEHLQHKCQKIFIHAPGIINEVTLFGTHEEQAYLYPTINQNNFNSKSHSIINQQLSADRLHGIANTFNNVAKFKKETNDHSKIDEHSKYRLYKKDDRIIKIPFATYRPSLQECNRIHSCLSNAWITFQNNNNDNAIRSSVHTNNSNLIVEEANLYNDELVSF